MPNFKTHILSGMISYPIVVFGWEMAGIISRGLPIQRWFTIDPGIIGIGFALYVFSADAPDIDHPQSLIQRFARIVAGLVVAGMTFQRLYGYWYKTRAFGEHFPMMSFAIFLSMLAGLLCSGLFSFLMPAHRGMIHTYWFGGLYACMIAGVYWLFQLGQIDSQLLLNHTIYLGLCGFLGFTLHIILDHTVSRFRRRHP